MICQFSMLTFVDSLVSHIFFKKKNWQPWWNVLNKHLCMKPHRLELQHLTDGDCTCHLNICIEFEKIEEDDFARKVIFKWFHLSSKINFVTRCKFLCWAWAQFTKAQCIPLHWPNGDWACYLDMIPQLTDNMNDFIFTVKCMGWSTMQISRAALTLYHGNYINNCGLQ